MLGLSKALILQPQLLLIDELSLGLAPVIVGQLLDMVREINAAGTAVVLVEQSVNIALNLVDHAYFMEKGEIRFDGAAPRPARPRRPAARRVPRRRHRRPRTEQAGAAMTLALTPWGFDIPLPVIVLGAIIGMTYGLLAVGLVLVYRTNRIINFAHGEIGAFGAAFFGTAVIRWHVPYYVGAAARARGRGRGWRALAEVAVVRRLRNAPRLMSIVATLGVGQFLCLLAPRSTAAAGAGSIFPSPPGLPEFTLRRAAAHPGVRRHAGVRPDRGARAGAFLRRSRFGLAMRCAAANPEAARMAGIFAGRMSSLAWALAGALSAFTAILILPSRGVSTGESFGPSLLLRALAGAVLARMNSLPAALAAGVGLGVVEQLLLWNYPRGGFVELALFVIILARAAPPARHRRPRGGEGQLGRGAGVAAACPKPWRGCARCRLLGPGAGRRVRRRRAAAPVVMTNASSVTLTTIMAFAIVGLSVGIVTGLGGQLSLGQFAIAAIGAVVSYKVSSSGRALPARVPVRRAGRRRRVAADRPARAAHQGPAAHGHARSASRWSRRLAAAAAVGARRRRSPIAAADVFGDELTTGKAYYYFVLVVLVLMLLLAHNIRRSGLGRLLVAVRDNEDNARAFTVPARLVKLAGVPARRLHRRHRRRGVRRTRCRASARASFPVQSAIDVVVHDGDRRHVAARPVRCSARCTSSASRRSCPSTPPGWSATQLGALLLILYLPGGLASALEPVRLRYARWAAGRNGIDLAAAEAGDDAGELARGRRAARLGGAGARASSRPARCCSRRSSCASASAASSRSTTCPSRCAPARSSGSSAPTAPARRRRSSCSAGSPRPTPAACSSTATTSPSSRPRSAASAASSARSRTPRCSRR